VASDGASRPPADPVRGSTGPLTEDAVVSWFQAAESAHPGVVVSYETFAARVSAVPEGTDFKADRASDLFLACACEQGNAAALARFESELMPAARTAMSRVTSRQDLVEEACQELRKRLYCQPSPKIATYSGQGPLWKWLRIVATRIAYDVCRSQAGTNAESADDIAATFARAEIDPALGAFRQSYAQLIRECIDKAIEGLTTEEKTLLRLRYVENQGIDGLAVVFRAHRATLARRLHNLREKILDDLHANLAIRLPRISKSEAKSLWRMVRSQIHLSLSRLT